MQQQSELFEELAPVVNSDGRFLEYLTDDKLIQIPLSVWKDGRTRADLAAYNAGVIVSRNRSNLEEKVVTALRSIFPSLIESVREEFARNRNSRNSSPRINNKRPPTSQVRSTTPARYVNPFSEAAEWTFAKCPDWLFVRREVTPTEKRVYAKLLLPLPPICTRYDKTLGAIFFLDQSELANALGIRRETANTALKNLRLRGLLEITGGLRAKKTVRFLWHEWMPSCALNAQATGPRDVRNTEDSCVETPQRHVRETWLTCSENPQVPEGIRQKREKSNREEKVGSLSDDEEWIKEVVNPEYPHWPIPALLDQWEMHGAKGKKTGRWIPGDRGHFLKAWMGQFDQTAPPVVKARREPPAKLDPSRIDLPNQFKSWVTDHRPEFRNHLSTWHTWADVPADLVDHWWGETGPPFAQHLK